MVERRPLGEVVHVFSHIRMTMRAELLVVEGGAALTPVARADGSEGEGEGRAAVQWVPHAGGWVGRGGAARAGRAERWASEQ